MHAQQKRQGQIAFVLKGYPRLSETFIAQEIHSLIELGMDIAIYSLRHPTDTSHHPIHDEIRANVNYLPEYLRAEPMRVIKALFRCLHFPGRRLAVSTWWQDFKRDRSQNRFRRFGQALVLAAELPSNTRLIHAHFLHTPASVARYAAQLLNLPWTCSAHAKDIWTSPEWELREKLEDCQWLTTCTAANVEFLSKLLPTSSINLNYHGLDLTRFPQAPLRSSERDGSDPENPVILLSVGRAVEKKGYFELLEALAALPKHQYWIFRHIGGGVLLDKLVNLARSLGIEERCQWLGAQPQQRVLAQYQEADLFVLNCKIDTNGDRDGLPNVIVEAQSQSLAVVSTNISGIPELITHKQNGLLVEQGETRALSEALSKLIGQPTLRQTLGQNGNNIVRSKLDKDQNIKDLHALLLNTTSD